MAFIKYKNKSPNVLLTQLLWVEKKETIFVVTLVLLCSEEHVNVSVLTPEQCASMTGGWRSC